MRRLLVLSLLFLFGCTAGAQTGTQHYLEWDPNTESDLSHYMAYWCDPGLGIDLTDPANCSKALNHGKWRLAPVPVGVKLRATIQPPQDGQVFFITALDTSENESDESNRAIWVAPVLPDTTAPIPPRNLGIVEEAI